MNHSSNLLGSLGGINKKTNKYEYPRIAIKTNKYMCPDCSKGLILRKGKIKVHHFAHYKDGNCSYYNHPSETQIHKDAKLLLKMLFEQKTPITIERKCDFNDECIQTVDIPEITESSSIIIEHRFTYNDELKIADVAYIDDGKLVYIFEICHTNKTDRNNRPDPWFEIDAITLINQVNNVSDIGSQLIIQCIRQETCDKCNLKNTYKPVMIQLINRFKVIEQNRQIKINEKKRLEIEKQKINYEQRVEKEKQEKDKKDKIKRIEKERQDEIYRVEKERQDENYRIEKIKQDEITRKYVIIRQDDEIKKYMELNNRYILYDKDKSNKLTFEKQDFDQLLVLRGIVRKHIKF